jgi:hypothetical protein
LNVAVATMGPVILTWQAPIPVQAPLHPAKVEPGLGVAKSVIT